MERSKVSPQVVCMHEKRIVQKNSAKLKIANSILSFPLEGIKLGQPDQGQLEGGEQCKEFLKIERAKGIQC